MIRLRYSIEKNVIDENTGTPIFEIEEDTGVIKTAVCCLDREKTPDYSIQVTANNTCRCERCSMCDGPQERENVGAVFPLL